VISEGYATASRLSQALGFATVAAFDAGNLAHAAAALHKRFHDKPVVIAGDDDRHLDLTQGKKSWQDEGAGSGHGSGRHLLLPIFAPGEGSYPAGLAPVTPENDRAYHPTGIGLSKTQLAALEQMKRHTDLNHLATQSRLGKDAIDRQAWAFVGDVICQHAARVAQPGQHCRAKIGRSCRSLDDTALRKSANHDGLAQNRRR
jgi:hypothetical protein